FKHEEAFRQEVFLAIIMIPLALYLGENGIERAFMISAIILIIIVELLNTGIEAVTDRVSLDHHELAKRAKDIGSAAVMLSFIYTSIVWIILIIN
ncbi:MAG: diacylglycerol kinase, partial [Pseudomonadota bacterium]